MSLLWGRINPYELLTEISEAGLLEDWQAYFQLFPFGQDHQDFLIAQLNADIRTALGTETRPTDCLPFHHAEPMTEDEIIRTVKGVLNRGDDRKS